MDALEELDISSCKRLLKTLCPAAAGVRVLDATSSTLSRLPDDMDALEGWTVRCNKQLAEPSAQQQRRRVRVLDASWNGCRSRRHVCADRTDGLKCTSLAPRIPALHQRRAVTGTVEP
jgi:hypothetical protein